MDTLAKLLVLIKGDFQLWAKKASGWASSLDKRFDEQNKAINALAKEVREQKPPEVNVPATVVNISPPEIKVTIPPFEVPTPQVTVNVPKIEIPKIDLPTINIPEIKLPVIRVPRPEVTVSPNITVQAPDEVKVKDLEKLFAQLLKAIGTTGFSIHDQVTRSEPLPVLLVTKDGKPYAAGGTTISGGGGPSYMPVAGSTGSGNGEIATAGTPVQLGDQQAKRVKITCSSANATLPNNGIIVIGGANVDAAEATRKGFPLYPSQSETFEVANLNLLHIDATDDGAKFHYFYEA